MNFLRRLFAKKRAVAPVRHIEAFRVDSELRKLGGGNMKVRIKETGVQYHVPAKNPVIDLLIAAGTIEPVVETPTPTPNTTGNKLGAYIPPKTPAHFSLQEEVSTGAYVIVWRCDGCKQGGRIVGALPEALAKVRVWHCGHVGGEAVPEEIAAQYASINKPAAGMFFPGVQPAPEYAKDANGNVIEAVSVRLERERASRGGGQ